MSNQFDRHPFDNALTHNAQLKVGGLETPVPVPEFAAGPLAALQQIAREMATQHAGDCTIYRLRMNGRPYDGICTCGYGWELVRKGDRSEMLSKEWEKEGSGTIKAFKTIMDALPKEPSLWMAECGVRIANMVAGFRQQTGGFPSAINYSLEIQAVFEQACAERDAEIARLKGYLERAGWGECNIPACNCNGWHHLRESREEREMQEQNRSLRALLERVPHREWSDYEKHSINGDDAIQFSSDCPKCAYEIAKLAKLTHEKTTAKEG